MGDRANIRWQEQRGGVFHFYTHWAGTELPDTLAAALIRGRNRWDDDAYLARIVFCEMVGGRPLELTGYGISTYVGDGEDRILTVDTKAQTVKDYEGVVRGFEDYIAYRARAQAQEASK